MSVERKTVQLPQEDAADTIRHLLEYLATYIREAWFLRERYDALEQRYDRLRRLFDQNDKGAA